MIAVLLVGGTAILPQLKGVLSIAIWSVPMPHTFRGFALTALDIVGRFVLVCQIFIVLVVVTLRTSIDGVPGIASDVVAEPIHSIAGATIALMCMMVVSQYTLALHDAVAPPLVPVVPFVPPSGSVPSGSSRNTVAFSPIQKMAMVVLLMGTVTTVCMALVSELLEFRIDGIAGDVLKYTTLSTTTLDVKHISLPRLPAMVYQDTEQKCIAAMVGGTIVLFTMVAPIVNVGCWLVQWVYFLSTDRNPHASNRSVVRWSAFVTTFSYAWCAFDVAFFSIGAASLEMDLVTQWIIDKQPVVGALCSTVAMMKGSEPCIKVVGTLSGGAYWMAGAAVMAAVLFGVTSVTFGLRSR